MASCITTFYTILPDYEAVCDSIIMNADKENYRNDWDNLYEGNIDDQDLAILSNHPTKDGPKVYGLNEMPFRNRGNAFKYLDKYLNRLSPIMKNGQKEAKRFRDHVCMLINSNKNVYYSLLGTSNESFYMVLGKQMTEEDRKESRYITFLKSAVTEHPPAAKPEPLHANLAIYTLSTFQKSLEDHILAVRGHLIPCLRALLTGQKNYIFKNETFPLSKSANRKIHQSERIFSDFRNFKWVIDGKECETEENKLCKIHLDGTSSDHLLVYREQKYSKRLLNIPKVYVLIGMYTHRDIDTRYGYSAQSRTPVNTTEKSTRELAEEEMRTIMSTFNIDLHTRQMRK